MPKKLLLIEYDGRALERLRSLLSPDYQVVEARDGEEGLQIYSSSRFDLVLLSGMLPRLSSAEVIREIRRRGGAMAPPIILMVAGYRGTNTKADAQKVGAFEILIRPFTDEELRKAVDAAADTVDPGRTMKIATANLRKTSALTSSDIFAEVLKEVAAEAAPASRPSATRDDMDRRLRETLAALGERAPAKPARPPAPSAPPARPGRSVGAEVDELLERTLRIQTRPRSAASTVPVPAAPAAAAPPPAPEPVSVPPGEPPAQPPLPEPPPVVQAQPAPAAPQSAPEAEASPAAAEEPARKRRGKQPPAIRLKIYPQPPSSAPSAPAPEAPASLAAAPNQKPAEVFASDVDRESRSRAPLYGMIAAAAILLGGAAVWVSSKPAAVPSRPIAASPTAVPAKPLAVAEAPPVPTVVPAPPPLDPRAVEAEVQRQLALKKKELEKQKAQQQPSPAPRTAAAAPTAPPPAAEPPKRVESPPVLVAAAPPAVGQEPAPSRPEPTAVVAAAQAPPPPAPAAEPVLERGDLVGPGPGVIEPALISAPRVTYPALARQQRVAGKVVVLLLVDEQGTVTDAKLQQGLPSKSGVNEAVVEAFRQARFRPATKNGVPMKMWRTLVVEVKP